MAVTSKDIARAAGVSQSTVSRALRGDPRVAPETAARVAEVARRMRYLPSAAARSLITNRTETIGVVVADITNPFYPQLVHALQDELGARGYRTVLLTERTDGDLLARLQGRSVDGLLFTSATLASPVVDEAVAQGIPVALLNRDADGVEADRVLSDNRAGGALAAEALLRLGHRRIALIAGEPGTSTARDREAGFRAALAAAGAPLDERLRRVGDYAHASGHRLALELLEGEPRPTAIFCANDVVAFGVLDAARRLGLAVPEQLSVIGYDDIEMASWELFSLTTIRQPLSEMARTAARLLVERVEGRDDPPPPRRHVFPAELVERATAGPAPT